MGGSVPPSDSESENMENQSAVLLRRLNPFCARALEAAASLCQTRARRCATTSSPRCWPATLA